MHELSIAMSIIDLVACEARDRGGVRISSVHLKLGMLSGVAKDSLLFSYELACEGTPLEGSSLVIEEIAAVTYCPTCETERTLDSVQHFCCPVCGSMTPEILRGKELEVVALEISDEHATATGRG